ALIRPSLTGHVNIKNSGLRAAVFFRPCTNAKPHPPVVIPARHRRNRFFHMSGEVYRHWW
ncbi:hypothetical protein J7424_22195, partial [Xanthomonas phaseoli pv. phaseoli]